MISPKFRSMLKGESVIRKMNSQGNAIAEKIGGENVFDFSIGNPSVAAPENLNAVFISEGMTQAERLAKLNAIAISQMKVLTEDHRLLQLDAAEDTQSKHD